MFLILHAFSRRNSGDGLLVDLTLEALEGAGIAASDCAILALDPESFGTSETVHRAPGEPFGRPSPRLVRAGVELVADTASLGRIGSVGRLVRQADGLIAVGGGYLVADSAVRKAGFVLNHTIQLSAAARADVPTVYLPQSIGPLLWPVRSMALKRLARLDRIYVRDDLTQSELGLANTRRVGDLAVMKLARSIETIQPVPPSGPPIIVARDLPRPGRYTTHLMRLAEILGDPLWAVQADAPGPRSDAAFYRRLGQESAGPFGSLLAGGAAGVVVSGRLHGAIAALLAGRPAIHLSYERKGWGAYEDLGLKEYVHEARDFDPELVARQVAELAESPARFWERIRAASRELADQYAGMVADLGTRLRDR